MIENQENTPDTPEEALWRIDEDLYDWACLSGCPPGFDCSKYPDEPIAPCYHGASNFDTKECSNCPVGYVCTPGRLPRPCPLGQYVLAEIDNSDANKITFAGKEFPMMTKYTCIDCPREFFISKIGTPDEILFLAGHKCRFAADKKTPCPRDYFQTYSNQTTCQKCDIGTGEKCHAWSKKDNSLIIGLTHITDTLGLSFSSIMLTAMSMVVYWGHIQYVTYCFFNSNQSCKML